MRRLFIIITVIVSLLTSVRITAVEAGDSLPADSCCHGASSTKWIRQLFDNGFQIHDPEVCYPGFPRFCLNIYNWGDRTFNSYDTTYVVGTGKNWKLQAKSYNWMESSMMVFPRRTSIAMHSDLYSDAGFSLSFMVVSIGYMWNVNKLFSSPTNRRTFNFDFTCSRFAINYQSVSSTGGMIITQFGDYQTDHRLHYRFDEASFNAKTLDAYWFFNNYKYSQGAAYSYSKYQLRNAGTPLVGINLTWQDISNDFSVLPPDMLAASPLDTPHFYTQYRSYCALGGYAYNWAIRPRKWVLNTSALVAVGYRQFLETSSHTSDIARFANNFRLNIAAVYNHKALFAALTTRMQGFINYNPGDMTHFNSYISFTAAVGMRF